MKKLTIENFRNFDRKVIIDLANITILTGTNNSGKSNIIKLISLLYDYFESDNHFTLNFHGPNAVNHKLGCYQSAVNWNSWENNPNFKITYERMHYEISLEFSPSKSKPEEITEVLIQEGELKEFIILNKKNSSKLSVTNIGNYEYKIYLDPLFLETITYRLFEETIDVEPQSLNTDKDKIQRLIEDEKNTEQQLESLIGLNETLTDSREKFLDNVDKIAFLNKQLKSIRSRLTVLEAYEKRNPFSGDAHIFNFKINEGEFIEFPNTIPKVIHIALDNYFAQIDYNYSHKHPLSDEIRKLEELLMWLISISCIHLGPDRSSQSRIYFNSESNNEISKMISFIKSDPFDNGSKADVFQKKWMNKFGIGSDYRIKNIEGIAPAIEVKNSNKWQNLVDKGFGAGQILTLIFRLAQYMQNYSYQENEFNRLYQIVGSHDFPPVLLIEEPESNLHPAYQSLLGELFHDVSKDYNISFIVETHSEYLIRKLKLLRAQKELIDSEAIIYYVNLNNEVDKEKEILEKIEILENGKLSKPFGKGFFDAADEIELDLYRLNRKK